MSSDEEKPHASENKKEDVYQVEQILKKRILDGVTQYWIKWKDYSEDENTWEPEENLFGCEVSKSKESLYY